MMKIVHSGDRVISRGSEGELERRSCSLICGSATENSDNTEDTKNVSCRDILGCIDCKYTVELLPWKRPGR